MQSLDRLARELSPWPFVAPGEIGGLGFGVAMLALCHPVGVGPSSQS